MRFEYEASQALPSVSFLRMLELLQRSASTRQQTEGFVAVEKRL